MEGMEEWDLEERATGGGPVIQEPVDTGNLDKAINNMSLLCATISSKVFKTFVTRLISSASQVR